MPSYIPISEPLIGNLLLVAKCYAKVKDVKLATVSRYCHGDQSALENLEKGEGSISLRKYDDAMTWLAGNWPADTPWPEFDRPFSTQRRGARQGGSSGKTKGIEKQGKASGKAGRQEKRPQAV